MEFDLTGSTLASFLSHPKLPKQARLSTKGQTPCKNRNLSKQLLHKNIRQKSSGELSCVWTAHGTQPMLRMSQILSKFEILIDPKYTQKDGTTIKQRVYLLAALARASDTLYEQEELTEQLNQSGNGK
jgi:hypothetical protein